MCIFVRVWVCDDPYVTHTLVFYIYARHSVSLTVIIIFTSLHPLLFLLAPLLPCFFSSPILSPPAVQRRCRNCRSTCPCCGRSTSKCSRNWWRRRGGAPCWRRRPLVTAPPRPPPHSPVTPSSAACWPSWLNFISETSTGACWEL